MCIILRNALLSNLVMGPGKTRARWFLGPDKPHTFFAHN